MSRFPSPRYSRRKSSGSRFYDSRNRIRGHALTEATKRGILVSFNNRRSELAAAIIGTNRFDYAFDTIGNRDIESANTETNAYTANCLNQYSSISNLCGSAPLREFQYDADGNLLRDGAFCYAYDAENRMIRATSLGQTNGAIRILNAYDSQNRCVKKTVQRYHAPDAMPPMPPPQGEWDDVETHVYFYDDWNLVKETVQRSNGSTIQRTYIWGKDLSGTLQGAGGVGGILAVSIDDVPYFPCYDHNGNVTHYLDSSGATVAAYAYDAFGRTLSATGPLADAFHHRFSTKYFDPETGLYYYGYRFYSPSLMRWLNRDPIEEEGGNNLYAFCKNTCIDSFDPLGQNRYIGSFDILGLWGTHGNLLRTAPHIGVAVDTWKKVKNGKGKCCFIWLKTGEMSFDYQPNYRSPFLPMALVPHLGAPGRVLQRNGMFLYEPKTIESFPEQDIAMLKLLQLEVANPPRYDILTHNCIHWSWKVILYGMGAISNPDSCQ